MLALVVMTYMLGITAQQATSQPMARPNCPDKCGNVTIPFPFGIGPSCFMDDWFEIDCQNNSAATPRPHLKRTKLEVVNITMDGKDYMLRQWLQVRSPIAFLNCTGKAQREALNLTGSPFQLSSRNIFAAVGCGVLAKLDSSSGTTFTEIGCTPLCSAAGARTESCEVESLPSMPNVLSISFNATSRGSHGCQFAFMVDQAFWSDYKNRSTSFVEILNSEFVPVELEWEMQYSYLDIFKTNMSMRNPIRCANLRASSVGYNGDGSPMDSSVATEAPLRCYCKGLRGNPYLIDGCTRDINECKELGVDYNPCGRGVTCVNKYGSYHCSYRRKYMLIGFGSALGALLLLFGPWGLYKLIKKRKESIRKKKFFKQNGGLLLQQQLSSDEGNIKKTKLFSSSELTKATDNFSTERVLGQGGQGTVYKGMLEDGKIVAVKKSKVVDKKKLAEFINEVVILSQINHRNVVQLLGCCLETEVPLLVYEFISNGTLSQYIQVPNKEFPLTWKMRLQIAAQVAGALSYLHSAASFPIYHRDIKSTNILLDDKYQAKVADFGTSRSISIEQSHLTTIVYGTFGYLDPEYFQSSQFTDKSDVYSFGVVLVELLTGQKPICASKVEEGMNLATYFIMIMEKGNLFDILDAYIREDGPKEEIIRTANLALACLSFYGRNRPTMKEVAMELEGMQKSEKEGQSNYKQSYEEIEIARADSIMSWDVVSMSTGSASNTTTRSSQLQELPLLSSEPR